ncbi:hypothetical protein VOLCADRAFT_107795 [Volvox carteri f. nagariensis]|uniref:Tyr recombinase domain-containing protein n=1 Tax=Volvox carteri f. nagariensis TaxID=3068 RepID=D8UGH0_VOLCA|nr:uncharacterized protein VOLCADRAFT_107795 [Volvox carteri f. nagariensis]EFJ41198.1 hypothetical protein VOLCADRAFT_107795 [Volvox carteri f. nagariensis]|eukprot:XP_002957766.1 hypothetical protein VOLCADRAFT_107795 [Volvox carteri f. nagariensis]
MSTINDNAPSTENVSTVPVPASLDPASVPPSLDPASVPASLDPASVPASLAATHRKQPARPAVAPEDLDARAEALLVALGAEADAELSTLATQFAQVAGQTLDPRTSNEYSRSWEPFREWWAARQLPGSIYDTSGEVVALYLLSLLNSSKEDKLMTVTAVAVMFAGFFRFDDAAEISVHEDLLVITATGMDVFIPRSKTDQQRQGHWVPIARVGGAACPVGLTERLLTLGRYKRRPDTPDEDVGPLLRPVQWNRAGGYLSGPLTGTVAQPIHSLSYPAFCHRLNKTLQAAGITRRITAHSMRIGGNSTAADRGVPADLHKAHGRWRSDAMVQHYTRRDGEAKLSVSRSLGLASGQTGWVAARGP